MKLPRAVARFNKRVNNPIQLSWAWLLPPWAIVIHRGRKSGREYRTPVVAFRSGDLFLVNVLYGSESDWVRNLLASNGGEVVRMGRTYRLLDPRLEEVAGSGRSTLSGLARLVTRLGDHVLVAQLGPRVVERSPRGYLRG
ncbi:MAG: nitroreductase/quinone reductase family protein [Myxococcales bacterium]